MKMLYKVTWEQRERFENGIWGFRSKERYAVGNSVREAIDFANRFIPDNCEKKNFNAVIVGGERAEYSLYEVKYLFGGGVVALYNKVLAPGRSSEEAIKYAMACTDNVEECSDFSAKKITDIAGFKVTLS